MTIFKQKAKKIRRVNLMRTLLSAFKGSEEVLVDIQTSQWEDRGTNNDGSKIEPEYVDRTVTLKQSKGQITAHVTLLDEGDFYMSIDASVGADDVTLTSNLSYSYDIDEKYGKEIWGFDNKSLDLIRDEFLNEIIIALWKKIM